MPGNYFAGCVPLALASLGVEDGADTTEERLLLFFDLFDEWFRRPDFESCSFMRTLMEVPDEADPVHKAARRHLDSVRSLLAAYAEEAGMRDPEAIAYQLQILMMGAILSATRGDREAAARARGVAEGFLETAR